MHILQTDRVEMPTPLDTKRPGLLINVHLGEACRDQDVMDEHARDLIRKENAAQYAGIAVVFWLQADGQRERLHVYEERAVGQADGHRVVQHHCHELANMKHSNELRMIIYEVARARRCKETDESIVAKIVTRGIPPEHAHAVLHEVTDGLKKGVSDMVNGHDGDVAGPSLYCARACSKPFKQLPVDNA